MIRGLSYASKWKISAVVILYLILFAVSAWYRFNEREQLEMTDVGRVMSARIFEKINVSTDADIQQALSKARRLHKKISVSGAKHSQGGHTFYEDAIVLDMRYYNKMLGLDKSHKVLRVQSGATWEQIQDYINPHGLAIRIMQSPNIFTVGGSMSTNAHGRDPNEGPLIESIQSFRLMTMDGRIIQASRTENKELFRAVNGGFGLMGVILDVDLQLTDDELYVEHMVPMTYKQFPKYFDNNIMSNPMVALTVARLSTAPHSFLTQMYTINYERTDQPLTPEYSELQDQRGIGTAKFIFGLARKWDWGKNTSWKLQKRLFAHDEGKLISRNNAMRPDITFTEYRDVQKTDVLQEYFVPVQQFVPFVDGLRHILKEENLNVVNITVRYVPRSSTALLSYARQDSFGIVLLINHKKSAADMLHLQTATQRLVELSLQFKGSYYLTYLPFPTKEQFRRAYPQAELFFRIKRIWDPEELFMNEFYARYN
ncbi:FAD-binding oxidoreductase [Paenibacillus sp. UMB4589-SE434]|uniref:FAD-binding oxidoreductase n=1 Tax=Paenibacillus sp. UMB4589-SE434 TaxID=3046314 RepID=UPI00254F139B|nr:FAD-binding oxidoreductase [Paenibacillus sp. UMB4589-SE434]MDK8180527.1 FAD-binding oxidoreductase [Paenibacillus sp. UMB4589-SE434]